MGLRHIARLPALTRLDLTAVRHITDGGIAAMSALPALQRLDLMLCRRLGDDALKFISILNANVRSNGSGGLRHLDLSYLRNVTDAGLWNLAQLSNLTYLNLFECKGLTDEGLKAVAALPALCELHGLSSPSFSNAGLSNLNALQRSLTCLDMSFFKRLNDEGADCIATLIRLSDLDLGGSEITDDGLAALRLPRLGVLSLRDCALVSGDGFLAAIRGLPALERVDVRGCSGLSAAALAQARQFVDTQGQ